MEKCPTSLLEALFTPESLEKATLPTRISDCLVTAIKQLDITAANTREDIQECVYNRTLEASKVFEKDDLIKKLRDKKAAMEAEHTQLVEANRQIVVALKAEPEVEPRNQKVKKYSEKTKEYVAKGDKMEMHLKAIGYTPDLTAEALKTTEDKIKDRRSVIDDLMKKVEPFKYVAPDNDAMVEKTKEMREKAKKAEEDIMSRLSFG